MPTWRTALTYKPVEAGSIYFAAGTSFKVNDLELSVAKLRTFENLLQDVCQEIFVEKREGEDEARRKAANQEHLSEKQEAKRKAEKRERSERAAKRAE